MISEKSSNFASNLVAPTQAVPAFVVTKKVSKRALARSKRCGVYHRRIVFARAENSILELKWWTLIGAVNSGVACLQFPLATKRERGEPNFWTPPGQTVFSWELNSQFFVVWRQNLLRVTFEEENIINFFVKTTFESDVIYNGTRI